MFGYCCKCADAPASYYAGGSSYSSGVLSGCGCSVLPRSWRVTSDTWSQLSTNTNCDLCNQTNIQNVLCDEYSGGCSWLKTYTCGQVGVEVTTTAIKATFRFERIGGGGFSVVLFEQTKANLGISSGDACLGPYLLPFVSITDSGSLGSRWCQFFGIPFNNEVTVTGA